MKKEKRKKHGKVVAVRKHVFSASVLTLRDHLSSRKGESDTKAVFALPADGIVRLFLFMPDYVKIYYVRILSQRFLPLHFRNHTSVVFSSRSSN